MKIHIFILSLALVLMAAKSSAQDAESNANNSLKHSFGVHAGAATGLGFSYRYFPEKWGVQVTGIPIFGNGSFYSSTGLSLLYKIKSHDKLDLFSYLGTHYMFERYNYIYQPWPETEPPVAITYNFLNIGFGAGVNIHLWEVLDLSLQAGYGVFDLTTSPVSNITGEIGLYYRF